jgi:thioredoxin 1
MEQTHVLLLIAGILLIAGCTQLADTDTGPKRTDIEIPQTTPPTQIETETATGESTYVGYTHEAYTQAQADGKVIFLEFYANWCPSCRVQEPILKQAFSELGDPNVAGFRVNYNDSETDDDERDRAREFGISYQHTHVIIDTEGNPVTKSLSLWQKDTVLQEIQKVTG